MVKEMTATLNHTGSQPSLSHFFVVVFSLHEANLYRSPRGTQLPKLPIAGPPLSPPSPFSPLNHFVLNSNPQITKQCIFASWSTTPPPRFCWIPSLINQLIFPIVKKEIKFFSAANLYVVPETCPFSYSSLDANEKNHKIINIHLGSTVYTWNEDIKKRIALMVTIWL